MQKIKFPILIMLSALIFAACGEDDTTPTGSGNSSVDNDSIYFPIKKGNQWVYEGDTDYTVTVTDSMKTIGDKDYHTLVSTDPEGKILGNSYWRKENGSYFYSVALDSLGNLMIEGLRENTKVGDTWGSEIPLSQYGKAKHDVEVLSIGAPRTVKGVIYKDVIAIKTVTSVVISIDFPGEDPIKIEEEITNQTTYYARGVGMIEQTSPLEGLNVQLVSKKLN